MSIPKFTSASQGKTGEEIDLNDIFSDYFTQEFDDPVNNPYSAMLAVAAQQSHQKMPGQQLQAQGGQVGAVQPFALPTGRGIMTPFHVGVLPTLSASAAHHLALNQQLQQLQQQQQNQPIQQAQQLQPGQQQLQQLQQQQHFQQQHGHTQLQQQMQQAQQQQTGMQNASINDQNYSQVTKKQKGGITLHANTNAQHLNSVSQQQLPPSSAPAPVSASGISSRLGIQIGAGGQLFMPQRGDRHQDPPHAMHTQTNGAAPAPAGGSIGGISLPVGHGVRLGGMIGTQAAPGTTASQQGMSGIMTHAQWGDKSKGGLLHMQHGHSGHILLDPEGGLSPQVIEERRQRNREHAKRSRVRKKFLLESLQEEVQELQDENKELRLVIQEHIPEHAQKILTDICAGSALFHDNVTSELVKSAVDKANHDGAGADALTSTDFTLMKALMSGQQCFVLSDPRLPDNPIVFASQGFYDLTGYSREEVLGRNCRFLQGPGTDPRAVEVIRKAVSKGTETSVLLLNYKADGTPFWNQFFIAPLRGADDNIVNYVGVQCLVEPDAGATALEEKVNAILPLQNKDEEEMAEMASKK